MKKLFKRIKSETPEFWRKVRTGMITVGTISGALLASPVALPAGIVALAGYGLTVGITGAVLSQLTSKDKTDETGS